MTTGQKIDRLTSIVETLAASVEAHDNQIGALIELAAKHDAQIARTEKAIAALTEQVANTERQWQAYIKTLPRQ